MRQRQKNLDWLFFEETEADDDQAWEMALADNSVADTTLPDHATPKRSICPRTGLRSRLFVLFLAGILAVAAGAHRLWQVAEVGIEQTRAEVQETADLEVWAQLNIDSHGAGPLVDGRADERWLRSHRWQQALARHWSDKKGAIVGVEVYDVEVRGDLAAADIVVTKSGIPWAPTPYRETRFYRQSKDGLVRTAPHVAFWGEKRNLETEYFRLEFHQRDAQAAECLASAVDTVYLNLRRDFGLESPGTADQITIEIGINPAASAGAATNSSLSASSRLAVTSPSLLPVPVDLSDAQALSYTVGSLLGNLVLDEAIEIREINPTWQPVVDGMRLWLTWGWDTNPLPSNERYRQEDALREWLAHAPPLRLTDLMVQPMQGYGWEAADWLQRPLQIMAAQVLTAHITDHYGRGELGLLLGAVGRHTNWAALAPAVFNHPASDLEVGWQAYLADHYR